MVLEVVGLCVPLASSYYSRLRCWTLAVNVGLDTSHNLCHSLDVINRLCGLRTFHCGQFNTLLGESRLSTSKTSHSAGYLLTRLRRNLSIGLARKNSLKKLLVRATNASLLINRSNFSHNQPPNHLPSFIVSSRSHDRSPSRLPHSTILYRPVNRPDLKFFRSSLDSSQTTNSYSLSYFYNLFSSWFLLLCLRQQKLAKILPCVF